MSENLTAKWNNYFMSIAETTANISKDPNTKVGCCLVKNKKILSIGYNGPPKNFPDEEAVILKSDLSKPLYKQKNTYMVHAELNAILNYDGELKNLQGSTLFITHSPCYECAKILAQVGVTKVIYKEKYHNNEFCNITDIIFRKCGVEQICIKEL